MTTKWFINGNLNLAYALMYVSWGPGTFLAGYLTPIMYGKQDDPHLGSTLMMGFWLNLASTFFVVVTCVIDKLADKEIEDLEKEKLDDIKNILVKDENDVTLDVVKKSTPCFKFSDCKGLSKIFWLNNAGSTA